LALLSGWFPLRLLRFLRGWLRLLLRCLLLLPLALGLALPRILNSYGLEDIFTPIWSGPHFLNLNIEFGHHDVS
jgi:hypothetical protein